MPIIHGVEVPQEMAEAVASWTDEFAKQCPIPAALTEYTNDVVEFLKASAVTLDAVLADTAWRIAQKHGLPYTHQSIVPTRK